MFRWLFFCLAVTAICVVAALYLFDYPNGPGSNSQGDGASATRSGGPGAAPDLPPLEEEDNKLEPVPAARPALVIENASLSVINTQNVAGEYDGKLLGICTDDFDESTLKANDEIIEGKYYLLLIRLDKGEITNDRVYTQTLSNGDKVNFRRWKEGDRIEPGKLAVRSITKKFRKLREGDHVKKGQLVALIDPTRTYHELAIKISKLDASSAELQASVATEREALKRLQRSDALVRDQPGAVSKDDLGLAVLTHQKSVEDVNKNVQAVETARRELGQVEEELERHEVRSAIDGEVRAIYKNIGEAVKSVDKSGDTLLLIQDAGRLSIEGQVDVQQAARLHKGDTVMVEPFLKVAFERELRGHTAPISGLAVSKATQIVSVSEDGSGLVWDRKTGKALARLRHNRVEVRSVACTGLEAASNWCATGTADGVIRLWDLDKLAGKPVLEMTKGHSKPVNYLAFSPSGRWLASACDDNSIALWDTASGNLVEKMPYHRARVTCVQFLSENQIVSAGADKIMLLVTFNDQGKPTHLNRFENRGGDVTVLGVNPATRQILFDKGKELLIKSMPEGNFAGDMQNSSRSTNFTTMALFSPKGDLVLTNDASRNYLALWRAPNPKTRGHELQNLVYDRSPATCGAFDPNNQFLVTGVQSGIVLVWPMPSPEDLDRRLTAWIGNVDSGLEGDQNKVRVKAYFDNPKGFLRPDDKVTMVMYP